MRSVARFERRNLRLPLREIVSRRLMGGGRRCRRLERSAAPGAWQATSSGRMMTGTNARRRLVACSGIYQ